ncbi:L-amino acid N-acyltransferase YncA [Stackebrandtia albiflava]|uniref:L-amino acid N-acyltransferase YncA n=1 Tax=Stackebrandtia albiflava TaxID=406432 RepID=A0A562UYH8_9ACTN|nr:GNAT family N-acetyltransferase [Stackebrandtia albiflava]TWJ10657.1 L-amino acid N-acyltransferase YncA [Stackebrandtia albiflava]
MEITAFAPGAPDTDRLTTETVGVIVAAADHDGFGAPPCTTLLSFELNETDNPEFHRDTWLARSGDETVGVAWLIRPAKENRHLARLGVVVSPDRRREGIGTALVARCLEAAAADGRRVVTADGAAPEDGDDDGGVAGAFARSLGFLHVHRTLWWRLDLAGVDREEEDRLRAAASDRSADYDLVSWVGRIPDARAAGFAALVSIVNGEVPHGDLEVEDMVVDVARLRADERRRAPSGVAVLYVVAVHRRTGETAAYTTVRLPETTPAHAAVGITLVHPEHRGRRLGLAVKLEAHRLLRERRPAVRWLETGNDDTNRHMIAINETLGFVRDGSVVTYRREW